MKTINLDTRYNCITKTYPDGQPHVRVAPVEKGEAVRVICSLRNPAKLLELLMCADALRTMQAVKAELLIPYFMGGRYDRIMQPGDSMDVRVVAEMVNTCGFERVYVLDPHSEATVLLLKNAIAVNNRALVEKYDGENALLICPDAGAVKKVLPYLEWNPALKEIIYCVKNRNTTTGKIELEVLQPEKCVGRNCVIVDDICDTGGTVLHIAEKISPARLSLVVTHGIFSEGFAQLEKHFSEILVTDSFYAQQVPPFVKVYSAEEIILQAIEGNLES